MIPQHPLDELLRAARQKRWTVVDQIIRDGTPINEIHPGIGRPIVSILASESQSFTIVKELLGRGADRDHALEGAAMGNQAGLVRYLIEQGGNINRALYGASVKNREALITELLEKGADPYWGTKGAARGNNLQLHQRLMINVFVTVFPTLQRASMACAEQAGVTPDDMNTAMTGNAEALTKVFAATGNFMQNLAGIAPAIHKELFPIYEVALGGHTARVLQLFTTSSCQNIPISRGKIS